MAVEDILKALDEKATAEHEKIMAQGRAEADAIIEQAENEAQRIREEKMMRVKKNVESDCAGIAYRTNQECKNCMMDAEETVVNQAFEETRKRLPEIHDSPGYRGTMKKLLRECGAKIRGKMVISGRRDDWPLIEDIMNELDAEYRLSEEPLDTAGGVEAESEDGSIVVHNTFESRLERARESLRTEVSRVLFPSPAGGEE